MKLSSLLVSLAFLLLPSAGCGGQSVTRNGDETNDDSGSGGSATAARGGSSTGTGGSSTGTGGSSTGKGGSGVARGGSSGTAGGAGGSTLCTNAIVASPTNNYSFSSILSFPPIGVRPDAELQFRWSGVTRDFLGHSLDPLTDIDMVHVAVWNRPHEELRTAIRDDDLRSSDISAIMTLYTEKMLTAADLFEFTSVATPLTPEMILPYFDAASYPAGKSMFTLVLASGEELGRGTRMIQGFELDPTSTNTLVEVTDDSTKLDYEVDLASHERTAIPARTSDITIDWRDMTESARGGLFIPTEITEVVVARYDENIAELEDRFLDLELIAEDMWRGEITSGTSMAFSSLTNAAGEPFTGIDERGTWLVALVCGSCANAAPPYLSVLTACPPGR